jgi:hypothetical protein
MDDFSLLMIFGVLIPIGLLQVALIIWPPED